MRLTDHSGLGTGAWLSTGGMTMELRESSTMRELSNEELGHVGGGLAPITINLGVFGDLVESLAVTTVTGLNGLLGGLFTGLTGAVGGLFGTLGGL